MNPGDRNPAVMRQRILLRRCFKNRPNFMPVSEHMEQSRAALFEERRRALTAFARRLRRYGMEDFWRFIQLAPIVDTDNRYREAFFLDLTLKEPSEYASRLRLQKALGKI